MKRKCIRLNIIKLQSKTKCVKKIYFCGFEQTEMHYKFIYSTMYFRQNLTKYRTQKVMKEITRLIFFFK